MPSAPVAAVPQPVTHSQGPTSPPHSTNKTMMWVILGIVLLLLVGVGSYFLGQQSVQPVASLPTPTTPPAIPTPDETANWKTYINSENGYSIKFPNDKLIRIICPKEELTLSIRSSSETQDEIDASTCARDSLYPIEVFVSKQDKYPKEPESDEYFSVSKQNIVVANLPALKYKVTPTGKSCDCQTGLTPGIEVRLDYKGKTYVFLLSKEEEAKTLETEFNKMLTTFKFTK